MAKPIHIIAIAPYPVFPARSGGQRCISFFYSYLSKQVPLTLVTANTDASVLPDDINVKTILGRSITRYFNPFLISKVRKEIIESGATHMIIEHPYMAWLGYILKKLCKIPLIIRSHNIESVRFRSTGKWWWGLLWHYERWAHKQADLNFFITPEDKTFAISKYKLDASKCCTITYGITWNTRPSKESKLKARKWLQEKHCIKEDEKIILFNGMLDYLPNKEGLQNILYHINPILQKNTQFRYRILICGKNLPVEFNQQSDELAPSVTYAGFVDDINSYFLGADIFLNPVIDGGGIKTKLVEALGNDLVSVSSINGAFGIPDDTAGKSLVRVENTNWQSYADNIININPALHIAETFFNYFYWGNIALAAKEIIINKND